MLNKEKALEAARMMLTDARAVEADRLNRIYNALKPTPPAPDDPTDPNAWHHDRVLIPADAPPQMKELAREAETNYLPLLVKTFGQVMKADGYISASDDGAADPWQWWLRNRMNARQTGLHRAVLAYGVAYATVLPGTYGRGEPGPAIGTYSPRQMTAAYASDDDEWPMLAAYVDRKHVVLLDEEAEYRFGIEDRLATSGPQPAASVQYGPGWLTYLETKAHNLGVTPVVRYLDRNLLAGEQSYGIVEPLIVINDRINELTFQEQVKHFMQAFRQRYLIGWVPKSEEARLRAGAGRMWYIDEDPDAVKIGELASDPTDLKLREASIRDFAAIGQIPAQTMGIDGISNISDATLAGLEAAKNREVAEITTSVGESHEQMLRLAAYVAGNQAAADDYDAELRWQDFEARSYAAVIDGLGKLVTMLGLDPEIALEDVPGMTGQRLERAKQALRMSRARQSLAGSTAGPSRVSEESTGGASGADFGG